jgi:hypothetical protein
VELIVEVGVIALGLHVSSGAVGRRRTIGGAILQLLLQIFHGHGRRANYGQEVIVYAEFILEARIFQIGLHIIELYCLLDNNFSNAGLERRNKRTSSTRHQIPLQRHKL